MQAMLVLEDGFSLKGETFSSRGEVFGEVVFNTSMTGYQEMLTDPSYRGQILVLTCPMIGNYGVNKNDSESVGPQVEGLLVKECCCSPSSRCAEQSLDTYLDKNDVIGVEGIDTRSLTLHLRSAGTMFGVISTEECDTEILQQRVLAYKNQYKRNLVAEVSAPELYSMSQFSRELLPGIDAPPGDPPLYHVVIYDFGIKYSILRSLSSRNCCITVVPYSTDADKIFKLQPDGVLLSNGPGDPIDQKIILPQIQSLLGRVPLFGICLGHQLLAMALGYSTYKLKFGHRGANHPVKELSSGKVLITSQNHGYCVKLKENRKGLEVTHLNLNDGTIEGIEDQDLICFSVQFHPEASPGPHDSNDIFDKFIEIMNKNRIKGGDRSA
jgi:carbamoyl-phosphate synthase small subunit